MLEIELIEPTKTLEYAAMDYRQEYIDYGEKRINGSCGFMHYPDYNEWLEKVKLAQNASTSFIKVPATTYFPMIKNSNKIVGNIQLRHYLSEDLKKRGGHIGFGIRPSERLKGYATQQLALVIAKARELGINKVMVSCDKNNIASARVIIKNGGMLTWEGFDGEDSEIKVFWINLIE